MTNALRNELEGRIATVLASPQFQNAWVEANRIAHHQFVALLRGDTVAVTIENGQVQLNLLPLMSAALHALQDAGVIPAAITLPDLTSQQAQDAAVAKLEAALHVDLPPDFGSIPLGNASALESLQTALRAFDILLIVTIVLTIAFIAATIWLSRSRLRGLLTVALGTIVALVLARLALQGIENAIVSSVANADGSATVRGVFDAVATDLVGLFRPLIIGGVVVAVVAYLAGRPAWLVSIVGSVRTSIRRAPTGPAEPVAVPAAASSVPYGTVVAQEPLTAGPSRRAALTAWATRYYEPLRWGGVALVGFALAWASLGWEVAVLAAALLAIYEFGLDAVTRPESGDALVPESGAEVTTAPSM